MKRRRSGKGKTAKKKTRRRKRKIENPFTSTWEELADTVPKKDWYEFRDLVLSADIKRELDPIELVEEYPDHPIVLIAKRHVERGNQRAMNEALKAVAGTDDRYLLLLMKSG